MKQIPGPLSGRSWAPRHGVYAFYRGQRIKIGTTEAMYSLRADQVHLVQPDPGSSSDPARDAARLLFRFPWPEEDGIEPGGYPMGLLLGPPAYVSASRCDRRCLDWARNLPVQERDAAPE